MPTALSGFAIVPLTELLLLVRPWLCELSAVPALPGSGAEEPITGAGDAAVSWAGAITASCKLSRPAATKTTTFTFTFILHAHRLLKRSIQLGRSSCVHESTV